MSGRNPPSYCTLTLIAMQGHQQKGRQTNTSSNNKDKSNTIIETSTAEDHDDENLHNPRTRPRYSPESRRDLYSAVSNGHTILLFKSRTCYYYMLHRYCRPRRCICFGRCRRAAGQCLIGPHTNNSNNNTKNTNQAIRCVTDDPLVVRRLERVVNHRGLHRVLRRIQSRRPPVPDAVRTHLPRCVHRRVVGQGRATVLPAV